MLFYTALFVDMGICMPVAYRLLKSAAVDRLVCTFLTELAESHQLNIKAADTPRAPGWIAKDSGTCLLMRYDGGKKLHSPKEIDAKSILVMQLAGD